VRWRRVELLFVVIIIVVVVVVISVDVAYAVTQTWRRHPTQFRATHLYSHWVEDSINKKLNLNMNFTCLAN